MSSLSVMDEFGATMLARVESAQIFEVYWDGVEGAFVMTEACDHYHSTLLTPEQLLALADEMRAMALEKMPPVNQNTSPAFPPVPQQAPTGMQGIETPSATDNLEGAPAP